MLSVWWLVEELFSSGLFPLDTVYLGYLWTLPCFWIQRVLYSLESLGPNGTTFLNFIEPLASTDLCLMYTFQNL